MTAPADLKLEQLWRLQDRLAEQRRRRENCSLRISYHERLATIYRAHVDRHERERERYELLLAAMFANNTEEEV